MNKAAARAYVIGIDIGTGSAKSVAVTDKGKVIANAQFYYPVNSPQQGFSEQDPDIIWKAFVKSIHQIIDVLQYAPVSISLSSAMHSLMAVNKTNQPITNLITWADTRSEKIAASIRQSPIAEDLYRQTGTPIHSMSPLCKIIWLKQNQPSIFKDAFKFISIKEFIWYKLFKVWEADQSVASATGLFNIHSRDWNLLSLKLCKLTSSRLSEIVSTNFIRTNIIPASAKTLRVPPGTSFCIGASDGCLANIGSYSSGPGVAALTIGTSGAVRIASKKPIANFAAMTFNYVLDEKTFICGGPVNNGGNVVLWLFKTFLQNANPSEKAYADLFKAVETIPAGSNGLIFLPYLYGERAPVWDEESCGVFFGIKSYHTNAHFLTAAIEGICYSLNHILEIIESSTNNVLQLNVSGGFINSKTWVKILAAITGKKVCVVETEDASSIGAALLNMKALKMIDDYASFMPPKKITFDPDMQQYESYKKYFSIFKSIYPALKDLMHQANQIK